VPAFGLIAWVVQTQLGRAEVKQKKMLLADSRQETAQPENYKKNKSACTVPAKKAQSLSLGLS
jgi:hypothetical protein